MPLLAKVSWHEPSTRKCSLQHMLCRQPRAQGSWMNMETLVFTSLWVECSTARICRNPSVSPVLLVLTIWTCSLKYQIRGQKVPKSVSVNGICGSIAGTHWQTGDCWWPLPCLKDGSAHLYHHLLCWLPLLTRTKQWATASQGSSADGPWARHCWLFPSDLICISHPLIPELATTFSSLLWTAAVTWGTLHGWWKLRPSWSPAAQRSLKPTCDKEAELVLKGNLINEQDRTWLKVFLSYFSSHFPSEEMSLLDLNPAAHSESQRHMFSVASPSSSVGFLHPCSFVQHVTNLIQGLLLLERPANSRTNGSLTSDLVNPQGTREKGKHGEHLC